MGKFGSKKPLNGKAKVNSVEINTPPRPDESVGITCDLESQYLSICYLLQSESEASLDLVRQKMILSRMMERLCNGTPRDIEELTLGTFSAALGWVSPDIVSGLVKDGLVELCHQLVQRYIESDGMNSRSADRSCELSIDLLCDLVNLDDQVVAWLLTNLDMYIGLLEKTLVTYPSVIIKRSCSRLISDLVQITPRAFVPGIPESRVTSESARILFSLCTSSDVETSCNMLIAGLALESEFGSNIIPTVANMSIILPQLLASILEEATTFVGTASDELELRISNHRSKVRGISTLLSYICEGIESDVLQDIRPDSIENQHFSIVSKKISSVEFEVFNKFVVQGIDFESIIRLVGLFTQTLATSVMTDRDVGNTSDMVGKLVQMLKTPLFRIKSVVSEQDQLRLVSFVTQLVGVVESSRVDLSVSNGLIAECTEVIVFALLSSFARKNPNWQSLISVVSEFLQKHFTPLIRESIEILDASVEDESQDRIAIACIQILDLIYRMSSQGFMGSFCAENLCLALSSLTEEHISVEVSCALMEAVFVVFGESDNDQYLSQIDAMKIFHSIAIFLKNHRGHSENVSGTIENINAFIQYKQR